MDRAGLPLRTGPESVDLVIADIGRRGLRGEVSFDPLIAAVAALVCGGLVTAVTLFFGQFSWVAVLGTMGGVFAIATPVLVWQTLSGIRRIEFRPPDAPDLVRVVRSVGADEYPVTRLRRILLRHKVHQSPTYPFTLRPFGYAELHLVFDGGTVRASLPADFDVPALGDRVRALLARDRVPVRVETERPGLYDPEVADDVLPRGGVVLEVMERRDRRLLAPMPGYMSLTELGLAWPVAWHVSKVAEANGVRTKLRRSSTAGGGQTSWWEYRAVDVQRVADAIAGGTAVLEPVWRRDTDEGRAAYAALTAPRRTRIR
ncbi:hypothetical protein ACTMTJ_13325 [Phytohabitans sp. LJ34]|uniref:hypothetical protein n=1 Tax=Phytohabitans sp. LJ34 TaxID=3452217 RepID=UPI003F8A5229